jgi:hypothetical protein
MGFGFNHCGPLFRRCEGSGTASMDGYGFIWCSSSFFDCDGAGTICGWRNNTLTVMSGNTCSAGCNTGAPNYCDDISDT